MHLSTKFSLRVLFHPADDAGGELEEANRVAPHGLEESGHVEKPHHGAEDAGLVVQA